MNIKDKKINMYKYSTLNFKTWDEFKSFLNKFGDNWVFRGQGDAEWDLKTSLERCVFFNNYENVESSFLTEFQRAARHYLSKEEIPKDLCEWLALMQHHDTPTRLLDFSKSSLAVYFASEFDSS